MYDVSVILLNVLLVLRKESCIRYNIQLWKTEDTKS